VLEKAARIRSRRSSQAIFIGERTVKNPLSRKTSSPIRGSVSLALAHFGRLLPAGLSLTENPVSPRSCELKCRKPFPCPICSPSLKLVIRNFVPDPVRLFIPIHSGGRGSESLAVLDPHLDIRICRFNELVQRCGARCASRTQFHVPHRFARALQQPRRVA